MTFRFNRDYAIFAAVLFIVEVLIARYVHDKIIRPWFGDFLVVILIYCAVKAVADTPVWPTAIGVLVFSFVIEALQYFDIVHKLGLGHSRLARIIIGTAFEWTDLIAYFLGITFVLFLERQRAR